MDKERKDRLQSIPRDDVIIGNIVMFRTILITISLLLLVICGSRLVEQRYAVYCRHLEKQNKCADTDSVTNYLFYAVSLRDTLHLSKKQYLKLVHAARALDGTVAGARKKGEDMTTAIAAHHLLRACLSSQQYALFLSVRNQSDARYYTLKDWHDITRYGLADPSDSMEVCSQIFPYQLERCIATDRYQHDIRQRKEAHAAIDLNRPRILLQLDVAKKTLQHADSVSKGYRGTFSW